MSKSAQPQTISVSEISALIKKAEAGQLSAADSPMVINLSRMLLMMISIIDDKEASLAKLRKMVFGPQSEKRLRREVIYRFVMRRDDHNPIFYYWYPNKTGGKSNLSV